MSAQPKEKRPPYFYTTAEVDVDISPSDLEEAGWVYVGTGGKDGQKPPIPEGRFEALIREFHEDEHNGPMVWCRHDLCMEVVR